MKKINKTILVAIVLATAGLMISSAASVPIKEITPKELLTHKQNNEITAHYTTINCQPLSKQDIRTNEQPLLFSSVPITGGDYDEYHPSVAGAPGGGYYAMAEYTEDDVIWHPMMYGSSDGVTWDPLVEFLYDNAEHTDMDQNEHGTYGTFGAPPDSSGQVIVLQGEIEDGWVWDFGSYNLDEFQYNRIACYTFEGPEGDPGTWNWGGLAFTGYNGYGGNDISGCPFIFYQYSEAGGGIIGWLTGDVSGCEHTGSDLDLATNMHYAVYDRDTGSGNYDLLVRIDDFGAWTYNSAGDYWVHDYEGSTNVEDTANLMYPVVAAYDDNVVVACQKDDDVIAYYSTNGFTTYSEVMVQESAYYPEIDVDSNGNLCLTYIKDDVLYKRTSDTGGASWSDAEVVSDNQVNLNYRAANLDEYNGLVHGVWEDTRGDNIDIYFDRVCGENGPPGVTNIDGDTSIPEGEPADYTFTAIDPDGDDVKYYIDWDDGDTEETGFNPSGDGVTVSHTWSEQGSYTITAYAEDTNGAAGPEGTLIIEVPLNNQQSKPLFSKILGNTIHSQILTRLLGL